jgi:hypothetical protein
MTPPSAEPAEVLAGLLADLRRRGISETALTGGLALGAWVAPRYTKDFDLCALVPESAVDPLLAQFEGIRVGPERIPSMIRFEFAGWSVDVFVAKTGYDLECLRRAVEVDLLGTKVRVVTPEDLVIHKLIKLRDDKRKLLQDAADIQALLQTCPMDSSYFESWLPPDEARFLAQAKSLDAAGLVARLQALG